MTIDELGQMRESLMRIKAYVTHLEDMCHIAKDAIWQAEEKISDQEQKLWDEQECLSVPRVAEYR